MTLLEQIASLPPEKRAALAAKAAEYRKRKTWVPMVDLRHLDQPTPQRLAYETKADILLYGGAAGGGKTDLVAGLALTQHRRSIIFRREHKQLSGIVERIIEARGTADGFNGQDERFSLPDGRLIRLGGMKNLGDEKAYQGRPFDLMAFDELTEFLEQQFRFVLTWNRSTNPNQRCRVVCASNPPTTSDGEWVIQFWAPWLDPQHPNPAQPGELRWFISDEFGKDKEIEGPEPIEVAGEMVVPRSRTFIPSSVDDNPFLVATGYKATLQALPEPLRSQMLRGDFTAGRADDAWQVIPTAWVDLAQERWAKGKPDKAKMTTMGVDVARGGKAETVLSPKYGDWYAEQVCVPGKDTPDGPATASLLVAHLRDKAQANIDAIGPGGEVVGHLRAIGFPVVGLMSADQTEELDQTRSIGFFNLRSMWWWRMREYLNPQNGHNVALPPDRRLRADLCGPRWRLSGRKIRVEPKEETIERIGRSPDRGDAAVYAQAVELMPPPSGKPLIPKRAIV